MTKKEKRAKRLTIEMNDYLLKRLGKRAKELNLSVSTYLRVISFMDMKLKYYETITYEIGIDNELIKKVDDKILS